MPLALGWQFAIGWVKGGQWYLLDKLLTVSSG